MFAIQLDCLDLNKIYKTQQGIRWFKIHKGKYIIPYKDKIICAEQSRDWLKLTCNEEEFYEIWYNYFDMNYDYAKANFEMYKQHKQLKKAQIVAKGLRILNSDILESLAVNILLQHYPKKEVKYLINNICMTCSKKRKNRLDGIEYTWYEFPTATQILDNKEKLSLYKIYDGFEDFISLCMFIENGSFTLDNTLSYKDRISELKELAIVNPEAANLICLYAYNMKEAFPNNNHVEEVMYMNDVEMKDFNKIKHIRGLANRYLLYYDKNVKKFADSYLQMADKVL